MPRLRTLELALLLSVVTVALVAERARAGVKPMCLGDVGQVHLVAIGVDRPSGREPIHGGQNDATALAAFLGGLSPRCSQSVAIKSDLLVGEDATFARVADVFASLRGTRLDTLVVAFSGVSHEDGLGLVDVTAPFLRDGSADGTAHLG